MNETFTDTIHTILQPTCSAPADTVVLGVLLQFCFYHTFTRASYSSLLGSAVRHVSICFCLRLRYYRMPAA